MTRKLRIHDGRAERDLVLVGTITVGRDPSCHINDLDPLLSRRHAEFVTKGDTVTVRDLSSRNGILVNGDRATEHVLSDGDLVQLGHLQLRYIEDHATQTPEAIVRAHATTATAMDAATLAARQVPSPAQLADTKPRAPQVHAAHADLDAEPTRAPGRRDDDPTVAPGHKPGARDLDATFAPGAALPVAAMPSDLDATFAPGSRDLDATFAAGAVDLDATFAPGGGKPAAAADADATFAPRGRDLDASRPPTAVDFDATFLPGRTPLPSARPDGDAARIVAGPDMRITSATDGCRHLFGVAPDTLLGRTLSDIVAQSVQMMAAGRGPTSLTLVVERSASDRTMTLTLATGQAAGILS